MPETICGPHLTDEAIFTCWAEKGHTGPHIIMTSVTMTSPDDGQMFIYLVDDSGRLAFPHPSDSNRMQEAAERYLESCYDG
ncbi:MAG: hypothetical protein ACE5F5_12855 [Acidimicrobiia bacterium]